MGFSIWQNKCFLESCLDGFRNDILDLIMKYKSNKKVLVVKISITWGVIISSVICLEFALVVFWLM